MKQVKLILLVLFFITFGFILFESSTENTKIPPTASGNDFILGAMNNFRDYSRDIVTDPDKFGMNLWHRYSGSQ